MDGVKGAEPADGIAYCMREVCKHIGASAKWIKVCHCQAPHHLVARSLTQFQIYAIYFTILT